MQYESITTESQLTDFCGQMARSKVIAFDTEFVSEDTYWSHLCLVQVAADDDVAIIDAMAIDDLKPFWQQLADGDHETIVHAGREELVFCYNAVGKPPAHLLDVQILAGLVGGDYPAGYSSLVMKFLGERLPKGETRTDWRRRPLSEHQVAYAVADVHYLVALRNKLYNKLASLQREDWFAEEMQDWQQEVIDYQSRPRWRKVSRISGLSPQGLAIVRELWQWREEQAQKLDRPPKRVLRDDLIVEMARRATADPKRIGAIRGMERGGMKRHIAAFSQCVERALKTPEKKAPRGKHHETPDQLNLLGQFLTAALTSICRRAQVAPSLVGTASDVRELIAHRLGFANRQQETPALARGWRAEVVGNTLNELLAGNLSIRIEDPHSPEPLAFEPSE